MVTFFIGLAILVVGGLTYVHLISTRILKPDDRIAPCFTQNDGVDYVPMKPWRTSLINLLNIAGTGPVIGPIMGILFGPIAFLLIPIGCVLAGTVHDYMMGMMSLRNKGAQMPTLIRKFTGPGVYAVYMVFVSLLLFLVAAVFIVTPANLFVGGILGLPLGPGSPAIWVAFAVILLYYLISTILPIQKVIGRVYPLFGIILISSAIGMFVMMMVGLFSSTYTLANVGFILNQSTWQQHPAGQLIIPMFFLTVACGILSGFHATQNTLIARSVRNERLAARYTYPYMMLVEGFIAMVWAAGAMIVINLDLVHSMAAIGQIGVIATTLLGPVGMFATLAVIILALTSGDTCLRGLRLIFSEALKYDQRPVKNRLFVALPIFGATFALLMWTTFANDGFNILWRYFAWANQTLGVFALGIGTIYLLARGNNLGSLITLFPGCFYLFVTTAFILSADIGLNLPLQPSLAIAGAAVVGYITYIYKQGMKFRHGELEYEAAPIYEMPQGLPATGD